ncbi:Uncharacterised protein [Serratia grimesii]|nr:Uncharacterised protein [Serratia grimesii]CAI2792758.1 Uncharacterised protein [Serratia grimesii]
MCYPYDKSDFSFILHLNSNKYRQGKRSIFQHFTQGPRAFAKLPHRVNEIAQRKASGSCYHSARFSIKPRQR